MKHYLVIFDRVRGEVLQEEEFADRASALRARFKAERSTRPAGDIEVVILGAESRQALRRTHARYFNTASQLARTELPRMTRT